LRRRELLKPPPTLQLLKRPEKTLLKMLRMRKRSRLPTVLHLRVMRARLMVKMSEMKVVLDKRKFLLLLILPIPRLI